LSKRLVFYVIGSELSRNIVLCRQCSSNIFAHIALDFFRVFFIV